MADDNKKGNEENVAFIHYDKVKLYPEGSIKLTGAETRDFCERDDGTTGGSRVQVIFLDPKYGPDSF